MVEAKELAIQRSKEYYDQIIFDRIAMCIILLVIGLAFLIELWSLKIEIKILYIIILLIVVISKLLLGYITDLRYKLAEQKFAKVVEYDNVYQHCYTAEDIESGKLVVIKQDYMDRQLFFKGDLIPYIKYHDDYKLNHMAKC